MSEKKCPVGNTCEGCGYDGMTNCIDIMIEAMKPAAVQEQEAPKAASQSAEELAKILFPKIYGCGIHTDQYAEGLRLTVETLKSTFAAQRQAGREEVARELSTFLGVCVPVAGKTLDDVYDPESNGCLFCPNCAKVCPYLISLAKGEPHAAG